MSKIQKFDAFLDSALKNKTIPEQVIARQKEIFDKEILPSLQSQKANPQTIAQAQKEWNHFTTRSMAARGFIADRGENEGIRKDKLDTLQASKQGKGALAYSGLKAGVKDLKTAVARSSLNTVGSVARWANDIGENEKDSFLDNVANAMQEGGDAELNNATENYQLGMRGERVFKGPISNFGYRAGQMGGESLMQMAMPLGLAKGAGMALKAVAGAGKVAATGAMATGLGAGYTQNYGGVRDSATQNLKRDFSNPDSLADNPLFQQKVKNLYDAGMDLTKAQARAYDETIDELSESKAEKWGKAITAVEFIAPGAATLGAKGAGRAVGQATVDRFTGLAATRAAVQQAANRVPRTGMSKLLPDTSFAANKASLGMVGRQGLEEGLQGGMENYAGQDASAEIGGKAVDWKAVGKQAAIEGAMGAIMGSGMQIASGHTPAKEARQISDNIQQQQNAIATAYPQAKTTLDAALQSGDQKAIEDAQLEFDAVGNAAQNTTQQLNEYGISSSPEFKGVLNELGLVNSADPLATDIGRKSDNQPFANKKAAQLFQKQNGLVDTHELVQLGRATKFVLRDKAAATQPDLTSNIPEPQAQPPVAEQQQAPMPEDAIVSEPIDSPIPTAEPVIGAPVEPPKAGLAGIVDRVRTRQAGQINTLKSQFISAYHSGDELLANQLIDQAINQHDLPQELVNQWLVEVGQVPEEQVQADPDNTVSQTEVNQNVTSPLNIFNQEYSAALQNNDAAAMHMATSKAFKSGLTGIEVQEAVQAARQTPPASTDLDLVFDENGVGRGVPKNTTPEQISSVPTDEAQLLKESIPDSAIDVNQDGSQAVNPQTAPTTTAGEFTQAFNTISKAASEGTRDQVAEYLREGKTERLTYSKPDAIEAALANENYNVQSNDDGSVTVVGVKDSQNNWVGVDPEAQIQTELTPQSTPEAQQQVFGESLQDFNNTVDQSEMQSGDIGRKSDGKPFANKGAATFYQNKNDLKESHEVVRLGNAAQFVLRPKVAQEERMDVEQKSENQTDAKPITQKTKEEVENARAERLRQKDVQDLHRLYGKASNTEIEKSIERLSKLIQKNHDLSIGQVVSGKRSTRKAVAAGAVDNFLRQRVDLETYLKARKSGEVIQEAISNPPTNEKSEPIESKDQASTHAYSKYNDVAKQYGRSVNANGAIVNSNGKDSGVRIVEKGKRVRVESYDGKLLFSGANPESLGNFIEEYWKGKKTEKAKSNERTEPQAIEKKINPDKPLASKNTKPTQGLTTNQTRQALIDRFGHDTIIKLETMGKLEVINELGSIPNDALSSIMVFHGSPYKFDKFSLEHLGRGDGHQLYGHGLYFSDSKAVSEFYRKNLAKNDDGQLYQVDIDSDSKDILNWEDSLTNQQTILDRLKPLQDHLQQQGVLEQYETMLGFPFDEWNGGELYTVLKHAAKNDVLPQPTIDLIEAVEMGRSDKAASMYLHHLGINGLKYAQSARDGVIPTGSSNYVIFDDSAIQITDTFFSQNPNGIEGYYHNGRVTLVAANLTPETVIPAFLHEMGGHAGMQGLMKPSVYNAIMQQFDQMVAAKNPLALEAKKRAEVETDPEVQKQEYLPYLITVATEAQQAGNGKGAAYQAVQRFIQRMVNAIKAWFVDKLGVNLKLNPDDVVALAERMVQRVAKAPATPSNGVNRSLNEASYSPFQKAIDRVVKGHTPQQFIKLGKTPNVLKMIGMPDASITIHGRTIEKVMGEHLGTEQGDHSHLHNLTPETLRQIPTQINNPVAIFKSGNQATKDGFIVLTELREKDLATGKDKSIIAALHVKKSNSDIEIINIVSIYGRSKSQMQTALNNDLLYWNKEKGQQFLKTDGLQLPQELQSDADLSTANIKTNEDLVKYQSGKPLFSRRHTDFEGIPQAPTQAKEWAKQRLKEDFVQGYSLRKTGEWIRYHAATPLHIALTDKQFKPVFDLIQERMNHVAAESSHAMNKAPELLGRRENFADFRKETTNAISKVAGAVNIGRNQYQTDMNAAGKALFDGTRIDEKVYSNKELEQQGLTPDQIKRYREMRAAIDTSLEQAAKTHMSIVAKVEDIFLSSQIHRLHDLDLPLKKHREQLEATLKAVRDAMNPKDQLDARTIKRIDKVLKQIDDIAKKTEHLQASGYAPMMRFGDHVLYVGDKTTGETKLYEMFETERERNRALESLKQAGVLTSNDEVSTSVKNPNEYKLFKEQGVNPETMALFAKEAGLDQDTMYQAYLKLAIAPQSSLKRMIHRKGVAGFSENAERVVSAFVISNARRSANLLYNQDIDSATMAIGDGKVQNYAQNLVDYTRNPMEEAANLRSFLFFMNMGFSFRYGLLNLTQPFIQTLPELSRYLNATQSSKLILSSNKLAWQSMRKDGEDALYGENSEFKADYEMLKRKGLLDPQNIWALQGRERGRSNAGSVWDVVQNASGTIAQLTETVNRRTAMLTALRAAKSMGPQKLKQKGFDSPFEFAAHIIQSTQGVMNKGNRPPIAQGIIGAPLMVFRTFSIQYVEQMIRLMKNPQYNGDRDKMRKALAFLMLILFGLAGAAGLPFVKDLIDIYETGRYYMGKPVNFERDVQELFGKDIAEHVLYGSINTFLFDMHGSTGAGDLLPGTRALHPDTGLAKGLLETGGATGGFINKIMDGTEAAVQGKYKLAGQTLAPRAVGSLWQSADIATTGEYRTKYGNNLSEGTVLDSALKALDLNPTGFAQMGRTRMLEREDTAIRAAAQKRFREELIEAKREGDKERIGEIKADIKAWNKSNPKYPVDIADSSIARSVKRQDAGWEERNKVPKGMEWVKELR